MDTSRHRDTLEVPRRALPSPGSPDLNRLRRFGEERDLRVLLAELRGVADDARELVVTPFAGGYGAPAGWIVALQGTPSPAMLVAHGQHGTVGHVAFIRGDEARPLSRARLAIVRAFLRARGVLS